MAVQGFPQTVRDRIMEHLKARFEAVQKDVDDSPLTWNTVVRRQLTDTEQQHGHAITLLDPGEVKNEEIGYMRCELTVITEFWIRLYQGDVPSVRLNEVMGEVQRTMRSDIYSTVTPGDPTTQLTINITEVRNEFDVDSPDDSLVGGVVAWNVIYRHHILDPRRLQCE